MKSEAGKIEGWFLLVKEYWTDINAMIKRKRDAYKNLLNGKPEHKNCRTALAAAAACECIGLTVENTHTRK